MYQMKNNTRKPISKRLRFEVLKRDRFSCIYCSAKPPNVVLEVDHILPVSKGGKNNIDNLVTACFDCNRGKSNILLDSIPDSLTQKMENKRIANEQHKQFLKILKQEKKQVEQEVDMVDEIFSVYNEGYILTDKSRMSVKGFIKTLGVESVIDSMQKACIKCNYDNGAWKYFCGICWNKIKDK